MSQTLIDVSKLKDFDTKAAVDGLATSIQSGTIATTGTLSGVTLAGNVAVPGWVDSSVTNTITAVGTANTNAVALTTAVNYVSSAGSSTGVVLPSAATVGIGGMVIVFNAGSNAIKVYGAGSDTIDGAAAATGVTLTNAKRCMYVVTAAATWISAQLGVVSA